jgi:hypothetical protein
MVTREMAQTGMLIRKHQRHPCSAKTPPSRRPGVVPIAKVTCLMAKYGPRLRSDDVAYNHLCEKINAACAQTLYESAKDQNGSRVCSTTNCTSHGENGDGKHHGVLSAPDIAQLAVHWLEDCAGEEKGGSDPREIGSKVQRIRNSGKRSVGDTAFESREKKRDANGDKGSPETRTSLPRH